MQKIIIDHENKFKHKCFTCGDDYTKVKFIHTDNSLEFYVNCITCRCLMRRREKLLESVNLLETKLEDIKGQVLNLDWEIYKRQENLIKKQ